MVHVPSQHIAGQVRELLGAERVAVVPLGSPDLAAAGRARAPAPASTAAPTCWPLGAKEPRKNLPRLVDAFGLLHASSPELALVLARARTVPTARPSTPPSAACPGAAAEQVLLAD